MRVASHLRRPYKGFVYVVGNYTEGIDGTLSPAFDVVLPASNSLSSNYNAETPTATEVVSAIRRSKILNLKYEPESRTTHNRRYY